VLRSSPAYPAALAVALALALCLANPAAVRASEISNTATADTASYQLTNTNPAGTTPVTKVVANVIPPGTIVPPSADSSPLTILAGSSGFDQNNLNVLLGAGKTPSGGPLQALALDFGPQGFKPGGVLNFSLSLDQAFQGTPTLQLPTDGTATGLSIVQTATATPDVSTQGSGGTVALQGGTTSAVPEPLSLALWSTGAMGLALIQVRRYRRTRPKVR
jgi:hypothetical protein